MNRIRDTLTPGKLAWLEQLEREGVANRPRGPVGRNCMMNGWTDWYIRLPDGRETLWRDAAIDERGYEHLGECLTKAGRARLNEHRTSQGASK